MPEPVLGGIPVTLLFLYFITYAFLGWCVETTYCCIIERRWVARGFLYGPICPIYGVGVLLMILFFAPLADHLVVFYLTATVVMSAWEYLVGWFLETTTHMKYWDYSHKPFNLKGRICLQISLCWGVLSYVTIFLIHPRVAALYAHIAPWVRYCMAGSAATLVAVDTVTTIRQLALTAKLMARLEAAGEQLKARTASVKADLGSKLEDSEPLAALRSRYDQLLAEAEQHSRRFRNRYHLTSDRFPQPLREVADRGALLRQTLAAVRKQHKAEH